jgi:hypothetical protein
VTTFPGSPRLLRGAIVGIDLFNPISSVILFQYNPSTVTRTLQAQTAGNTGEGNTRTTALRLTGAPIENIKLDAEFDATDQLEKGNVLASNLGIYPQLSALEMLVYPKTAKVILQTVALAAGTKEIVPPLAPFTVLIWGIKRVLPVKVMEFSITEEEYDVNLNPIRARVSLGLRVMSYNDFTVTNPGYYLFLAHQAAKEAMATANTVNQAVEVAQRVTIPRLL